MQNPAKPIQFIGVLMSVVFAASVLAFAQQGNGQNGTPLPKANPDAPIPAFHDAPPKEPLPDPVPPSQFTDQLSKTAYAMAAKVRNVLYQEPCYCYCDRNDGHHSLYDCFLTTHASGCNTCRMEGIFAYEQTQKGESAAQIRKEIIAGDWRKLKPEDYSMPKDVR